MAPRFNLAGERFGYLRVIEQAPTRRDKNRTTMWVCLCDCGTRTTVPSHDLRSGHTRSCGCAKSAMLSAAFTRHGQSKKRAKTRTYNAWINMRTRCYDKVGSDYPNYGGRGIQVCERWQTFDNFLADMGEVPTRMTLERADNNGNYEPSNCVWRDRTTQARNRRNTRRATYNGVTKTLAEWAEESGKSLGLLVNRLRRGWDIGTAMSHPLCPHGHKTKNSRNASAAVEAKAS